MTDEKLPPLEFGSIEELLAAAKLAKQKPNVAKNKIKHGDKILPDGIVMGEGGYPVDLSMGAASATQGERKMQTLTVEGETYMAASRREGYTYGEVEFVATSSEPGVRPNSTYKVINFYVREGDTWNKLLIDAKREKEYVGPGVIIVAHSHGWGSACTRMRSKSKTEPLPKCREV